MKLINFPVIKEIWRNHHLGEGETISIINQIDSKTPILPRFKEAEDFHSFLSQCCVYGINHEVLLKDTQIRVNTVKSNYLDEFLASTQILLNQFHRRYR